MNRRECITLRGGAAAAWRRPWDRALRDRRGAGYTYPNEQVGLELSAVTYGLQGA
jgi:hypothetical protein